MTFPFSRWKVSLRFRRWGVLFSGQNWQVKWIVQCFGSVAGRSRCDFNRVIVGFLRGGVLNWGTVRIPKEDWGTLGKIRGITTPPVGILLSPNGKLVVWGPVVWIPIGSPYERILLGLGLRDQHVFSLENIAETSDISWHLFVELTAGWCATQMQKDVPCN